MTDATISAVPPAALDDNFFILLISSYARTVGKPLLSGNQDAAWLYGEAPFAVLAHSTAADPIFVYANRTAQSCFEYKWDEFVTIPSRLSAEAPNRDERQRLLDAVARNGFIDNYRGLRIAKSGRRFWIEGGIVWELRDENGERHGQAALFTSWTDV
ncbi:MEKHLA domain-containing protein [Tardiphaga robiniae]|uniref:MEKHLA domain-containing protein n=1 Tax=Tardiphaga robiniae TaxID=943830 RepID=A0A161QZE7_9BRAD|nr:MEKHLA domain-containing protein [Tardiphaga robiniae]KZD21571.1 MEKHLA domain-containing protein [Tardiphaga robiniae]